MKFCTVAFIIYVSLFVALHERSVFLRERVFSHFCLLGKELFMVTLEIVFKVLGS